MARVPTGGDELTATEELLVQNSTALSAAGAGEFFRKTGQTTVEHATPTGSVGGSTGSTDNAILRANGTGGATIQSTGVIIDDSNNLLLPTGTKIDWASGDVTLTHSSNALTLAGGDLIVPNLTVLTNLTVQTITGESNQELVIAAASDGISMTGDYLSVETTGSSTFDADDWALRATNGITVEYGAAGGAGFSKTGDANTFGFLNFDNIATSNKTFTLPNASGTFALTANPTTLTPASSDGAALGTTALMWSDLFLASGAVVNFDNSDVTITHTANKITVAGGDLEVPDDAYDATGWNGNNEVPTKNAIRDKIESLSSGGDLVVTAFPGSGYLSGATLSSDVGPTFFKPVISYANGTQNSWNVNVKVPSGATSISSIKVYYVQARTGNIWLRFYSGRIDGDSAAAAQEDVTDAGAVYASGGSDSAINSITVPSTSYNGLTNIDADDIIYLQIYRDSAQGTDTYEGTFLVTHVQFTFA